MSDAACVPVAQKAGVLSARGLRVLNRENPVDAFFENYFSNPYHATENPQGVINLGVAENSLCADILTERLRRPDCLHYDGKMEYFPFLGTTRVRSSLAKFITKRFRAVNPVDPDHVCVVSGVGGALDVLSFLIANENDYFLCLSPTYHNAEADFAYRSSVKCHFIQLTQEDCYEITREKLEKAYDEVTEQGGTVRAVVVFNPNNPLGDVYDVETINTFLNFASSHDLHILFDEIYALSVHDPNVTFHSVLSLESVPDPSKTHFMWGFSKDFGLSSFRTAVIITREAEVRNCLARVVYFGAVPVLIQNMLTSMLEDKEWLDTVYFPANISRIRTSYEYACERLDKLAIPYHPSQAGFFIWADFTKVLKKQTGEEENELFKQLLEKQNILLIPGSAQRYTIPGWFRITITHPRETLREAFNRVERAVIEYIASFQHTAILRPGN